MFQRDSSHFGQGTAKGGIRLGPNEHRRGAWMHLLKFYSSVDDYITIAIKNTDRSFISMQVAKQFISVFERVNNALEADKSIDSSLSGTTAVSGMFS
jgi:hypothetical protein